MAGIVKAVGINLQSSSVINLKETAKFEHLGVGRMITLKWIFNT
jgi:hypothetical protein